MKLHPHKLHPCSCRKILGLNGTHIRGKVQDLIAERACLAYFGFFVGFFFARLSTSIHPTPGLLISLSHHRQMQTPKLGVLNQEK